jgi:16S rRNA (adenine1518-N6/adenine1519-N6)-dimethyltransferase
MRQARRRALGQHFLVDRAAAERFADALEVAPGEAVLEIGPGHGALTAPLVRRAGRILAVERDARLAGMLRQRFDAASLILVEANVLDVDLSELARRLAATTLLVAGNLPYSISKPIAQMLIAQRAVVERAVLSFQREVAERLTAPPGGRSYGPLGILAGEAFTIERLFDLPPRAFRPPPQVTSRVIRLRRAAGVSFGPVEEARLRHCLRVAFASRRRTLRNNLRAVLGDDTATERVLAAAGLDGALRAEAIPAAGFRRLAAAWGEVLPARERSSPGQANDSRDSH